MNCKQGDLAAVVRVPEGTDPGIAAFVMGRIFPCNEMVVIDGTESWRLPKPITYIDPLYGFVIPLTCIEDYCLQPIRGVDQHIIVEDVCHVH